MPDEEVTPAESIPVMSSRRSRVTLDLEDPSALAEFLELAARIVRARRRVTISIE